MLLPRSLRSQNRMTVVLLTYCFAMLGYLGLFSGYPAVPDDAVELMEEVTTVLIRRTRVVLKETYNTTTIPVKVSQEQKIFFRSDDKYEHLLNPQFPLSGGLKSPKPGYKLGNIRKNADVIIGITTVQRKGGDYLLDTIRSLLVNRRVKDASFRIVVFIGETNETYIKHRTNEILQAFEDQVHFGEVEVISPPDNYYPNWDISITKTLNDSLDRVKWRSKQNLDQLFIMMYVYNLFPTYYLMMEDDVISKVGYDKKILDTTRQRQQGDWFLISFCGLGAIGKLYRNIKLPSFATFIHTFWNKKPLDWLQLDYVISAYCSHDQDRKACFETRRGKMPAVLPSIFQHVGKFSSLDGKIQKLRDNTFNNSGKPASSKPPTSLKSPQSPQKIIK